MAFMVALDGAESSKLPNTLLPKVAENLDTSESHHRAMEARAPAGTFLFPCTELMDEFSSKSPPPTVVGSLEDPRNKSRKFSTQIARQVKKL